MSPFFLCPAVKWTACRLRYLFQLFFSRPKVHKISNITYFLANFLSMCHNEIDFFTGKNPIYVKQVEIALMKAQ